MELHHQNQAFNNDHFHSLRSMDITVFQVNLFLFSYLYYIFQDFTFVSNIVLSFRKMLNIPIDLAVCGLKLPYGVITMLAKDI